MITRLVGDVHGKYDPYKRILTAADEAGIATIQVGDMGVGFRRRAADMGSSDLFPNPPHYAMTRGAGHRFIRGNHDNPAECRKHSQWIPDGMVSGDAMFIGGATSIDRHCRVEGYSWWCDEELSASQLCDLVDVYKITRPRVMITHECPESVADAMLEERNLTKFPDWSRTRQAFHAMFEIHQPEIWVHGHWHISSDRVLNGTRFICLAELEYRDIEL